MHKLIGVSAAFALFIAGAGAVPAVAQAVEVVTMKSGESQHVTLTVPGYDVTGSYADIDGPVTMVVLNKDGNGEWRGDTKEPIGKMRWRIAADPAGKPLTQTSPNGQAHTLLVDFGDGKWYGFELAIAREPRQMYINRERVKAY